MRARIVLSVLAVLFLTTGAALAAQHPEKAAVRQAAVSLPLDRPLISIALENREELVLSDDQIQRLRALRSQFQKDAIQRRAELRIQEIELDELVAREPLDLAAVEGKLKRIEGLRSDGRLSLIRTLEQGKALLSDEQQKKLATLLQRHGQRRPHPRGGPGMMMGMRGCPMTGPASS